MKNTINSIALLLVLTVIFSGFGCMDAVEAGAAESDDEIYCLTGGDMDVLSHDQRFQQNGSCTLSVTGGIADKQQFEKWFEKIPENYTKKILDDCNLYKMVVSQDGKEINDLEDIYVVLPSATWEHSYIYEVNEDGSVTKLEPCPYEVSMHCMPGGCVVAGKASHLGLFIVVNPHSCGDINYDDHIDAMDALMVLQHVTGLVQLDDMTKVTADADADGEVKVEDALLLLKYTVGITGWLPGFGC